MFSGDLARSIEIYVIGLSFWIFLASCWVKGFFYYFYFPFGEDGAVLRLLGEEWTGSEL